MSVSTEAPPKSKTEIEVFVQNTLSSIFLAVHQANYIDMSGGGSYVLTSEAGGGKSYPMANKFEFEMPPSVTFDIAITASENSKANGGLDLKVAKLGADSENSRASVSRVQFAIPVTDRRK